MYAQQYLLIYVGSRNKYGIFIAGVIEIFKGSVRSQLFSPILNNLFINMGKKGKYVHFSFGTSGWLITNKANTIS